METETSSSHLNRAAVEAGQRCIDQGFAFPVPILSPQKADFFRRLLVNYERQVNSCNEGSHNCNCLRSQKDKQNSNNDKAEETTTPSHNASSSSSTTALLSGDNRFKIHLLFPSIWDEVVHHPTIIALARTALATDDVWCWSTDVNTKEAGTGKLYTWHQDSTYAGIDPPGKAVTIWLALTPSTEESGCVRCIPHSHRIGQLPHVEGRGGADNALALKQEIVNFSPCPLVSSSKLPSLSCHPDDAVPMVVQPGEASIHNFLTVHESKPNCSRYRRTGLALRFVSAHAAKKNVLNGSKEFATLVSGEGRGLFEPEQRPKQALGEVEWERHANAMARERANYLPAYKQSYS